MVEINYIVNIKAIHDKNLRKWSEFWGFSIASLIYKPKKQNWQKNLYLAPVGCQKYRRMLKIFNFHILFI